jgi:hypothetical protein
MNSEAGRGADILLVFAGHCQSSAFHETQNRVCGERYHIASCSSIIVSIENLRQPSHSLKERFPSAAVIQFSHTGLTALSSHLRASSIYALFATTIGLTLGLQPFSMDVFALNPLRELALPTASIFVCWGETAGRAPFGEIDWTGEMSGVKLAL